jgi:hypothetical protein
MTHIIYTLFPIFAVIGIGYLLAKREFLSKQFLNELNQFVYWVSLPAMIVFSLSNAKELPDGIFKSLLIFFAATSCVIALAFLNARILRLQRWQFGTFVQASFRGNLAYIGIPILIYAVRDQDSEAIAGIVTQAIFLFAPVMIFYNVVSVIVLIGSQEGNSSGNLSKTITGVAKNPLILAAIAGGIIFFLPFSLPVPINNTLEYIGRVAGPAALLCVGGGMALVSMQGRYRSALFASVLKTAAVPLFTYWISLPFHLSSTTTLTLMIFAATPTAVASYVMAKQLKGDEAMASGGIVISTLLSVISIAVIVGLF